MWSTVILESTRRVWNRCHKVARLTRTKLFDLDAPRGNDKVMQQPWRFVAQLDADAFARLESDQWIRHALLPIDDEAHAPRDDGDLTRLPLSVASGDECCEEGAMEDLPRSSQR